MINWQYYPKRKETPIHLKDIIDIFVSNENLISSDKHKLHSNEVLEQVSLNLLELNYKVENSKKSEDKIKVPVLFGMNGKLEKYFDADAYNEELKTVIEVEAGRAVSNYQFLKDFRTANLSLSIFSFVPQAWTIGMEIMFYLLVPFLVRLKNYFLIGLAIAAFLFRLLMYHKGYDFDPWTYRFFPFEFMFFIFGLLAFRFYQYLRIKALSSLIQNITYGFILSFILLVYPIISNN